MKGHVLKSVAASMIIAGSITVTPTANAGMEPFVGEITWVGFSFCPRGYAEANGQLLPISSNTTLFSLLGTTYGGDGRTNFALPDLRARSAVHAGTGPGLNTIKQGTKGGAEQTTLTTNNLPSHTHTATMHGTTGNANSGTVTGALAGDTGREQIYSNAADATISNMSDRAISVNATGGGQGFNIRSPYLALRACIALQGIYPSRN